MTERDNADFRPATNDVFEAIAHHRRRTTLRVLGRVTEATTEELATHVVAAERDASLVNVTREEVERASAGLVHVHLPKLAAADLVEWGDEGERLSATDHPALTDPKFEAVIDVDAAEWDEVLGCLADERRRVVLSTLAGRDDAVDREDLAAAVAENRPAGRERVRTRLHHVDLPKLDRAGLVAYDRDEASVTYEGHPELDEEWLVAGTDDSARAVLPTAQRTDDVWTVEGRENVTERGRALCEYADDELFMMFTDPDLLETACLRRLRDAADRGVDVYLGSQNADLRDLVREEAPDVTLWEPQMDWLNLPPRRETVGRLIVADREAVMIGTLGEEDRDGVPDERAITGTGADNPLAALLRELLGSRLDHLDAQSPDFLCELPQ